MASTEKHQDPLQSHLGGAKGLGSAKHGVEHWWVQRLTAVALVPLTLWFVYSLVTLTSTDYLTAHAWVAQPWNAMLLLAFFTAALWHARLGVQVIVEDYVHKKCMRLFKMVSLNFLVAALLLITWFSILSITLEPTV